MLFESVLGQPYIVPLGLGAMVVQAIAYLLFLYVLPPGPWKSLPSFTAHQFVAFCTMLYTTVFGFYVWFVELDCQDMVYEVNPSGLFLGRLVFGLMLFWDIPTGLVSDGLGDAIMLAHHVGMMLVSGIAIGGIFYSEPIASCYAPFFFGVVELSSIPLAVVDVFHPKQRAWHEWHLKSNFWKSVNGACRIAFALLYVACRCLYFPYVVVLHAVPDFWAALQQDEAKGAMALWSLIVFSLMFTALQVYWGFLVVKQITKAVLGGGDKKKSE